MVLSDGEFRKRGQYFPFSYLEGFLRFVAENRSRIELITYADLALDEDSNYREHYPQEYRGWVESLRRGDVDPSKIYLLLQHDVDRDPDRTHAALELERTLGLRSNVMIFNEKIERSALSREGRLVYTPYELDYGELCDLESHGYVIGYHSNAVERALFDFEKAVDIFRDDVEQLRQQFEIKYFSPHGGVRDSAGHSNAHMDLPFDVMEELRWVQNRFTVRFAATFSDGAIAGVNRDPVGRDLREFVKTWKPGNRYRVLIHPQYYDFEFVQSNMLSRADWYVELCRRAHECPDEDPWRGVELEGVVGE